NNPASGFPLQSLPYCVFSGEDGRPSIGVGIGPAILDFHACSRGGMLDGLSDPVRKASEAETLNSLMACDAADQAALRSRLMDLLDASVDEAMRPAVSKAFRPRDSATL